MGPSSFAAPRMLDAEQTQALDAQIGAIEQRLAALAQALLDNDIRAIENCANELQRALAQALDGFQAASRHGHVPPPLRQRLVRASGQVAAQRDTLARATAALDRAIESLIPRAASGYTAAGACARPASGGLTVA
ncbi:hypothetical protein [Caldimonas sp. KR1-144]|uniref:hypothetical protein n=1 Tax=Caldimonas sp. KR1-144 TaxID=3400911 RepID=UPI003C02AC8E